MIIDAHAPMLVWHESFSRQPWMFGEWKAGLVDMFDGRATSGEETGASATIACWETGLNDTRIDIQVFHRQLQQRGPSRT